MAYNIFTFLIVLINLFKTIWHPLFWLVTLLVKIG